MQIDWFTFGAQIVNFLILIGLLHRFLYRPILSAMDAREERIAERLEAARQKEAEAEAQAESYRAQQEEVERQRKERLAAAEEDAEAHRQELIREARAEVDRMETAWREALRRERASFLSELSRRAAEETIAVARRALEDLADADLQRQATQRFIERLSAREDKEHEQLVEALHDGDEVVVRSAFSLDAEQRQRITRVLRDRFDLDGEPRFETDASLGVGIEIQTGAQRLAWNLQTYLDALARNVQERLDAELYAAAEDEAPVDADER